LKPKIQTVELDLAALNEASKICSSFKTQYYKTFL
jgi:hypothetical protein